MPTYQYACTECGHRFDAVQAFTDDALTSCPNCSGKLRKVFSSVGVVFKGSGFYRTDSRSTKESVAPAAASTSAKSESTSSSSDSGASKPASSSSDSSTSSSKPASSTPAAAAAS
ncbi:FmdB family zinc ribbon protein [Fodinicola feengrottensis]|uniref:FmdB family zinc ribbon protein n=1 Tax=Fodinicola feengrottensis TaxID=435914 RepID=UPI0013D621B9|nr:FmdB family zinc ribbon protein [Fodinicola feengrottensis]